MQTETREQQYKRWYAQGAAALELHELKHLEETFFTWKGFLAWYESQFEPKAIWKKIDRDTPPKNLVIARYKTGRPYIGYIQVEESEIWVKLSEHDYDSEKVTHYMDLTIIENLPFETTK